MRLGQRSEHRRWQRARGAVWALLAAAILVAPAGGDGIAEPAAPPAVPPETAATSLPASAATVPAATVPATAPAPPATPPVWTPPGKPFSQALIITIEGAISEITYDSIERRLREEGVEGSPLVIFELDTPGGALAPTIDICKLIKEMRDDGVAVYAWINKDAYSAGTIIALATDGIIMARNATIGDCQPIMVTSEGASAVPDDIEAKATSPLLAELRDSARRNGYSLDMVMALIRPEMQMFWVQNTQTGERQFVDKVGRDRLFGLPSPRRSSRDRDDKNDDEQREDTSEPIPDTQSKTAWRYVREVPILGEIRQPIVTDRELLTMRTAYATAYGFSLATVNNESELRELFDISGAITRLENNWMETFIEWLASPMVRAVLFLLMLLGAYTEFQTPGFGLPGAVAMIALVLFLGAPYLAGTTVVWELVAIVAGIALLMVEIFLIPGFGVAGIAGVILIMVGLVMSYVPPEPTFDPGKIRLPSLELSYTYFANGLYSLAGGLAGSMVGMFLVAKYFPKMPVGSRIISANPTREQVQMEDPYHGLAQVGDVGRTESLLRPAGKARFGAILVDVVSQGEYILSDVRIEVIERHGNRVVVRPVIDDLSGRKESLG